MGECDDVIRLNRSFDTTRSSKWLSTVQRRKRPKSFDTPRFYKKRHSTKSDHRQRIISCNLVNSANTLFNPLCQLVPCYQKLKYIDGNHEGHFKTVNVLCRRCGDLKDADREACFNIVDKSWRDTSDIPPTWTKVQKWHEMFDLFNAWYILCQCEGAVVGFVHFRFEVRSIKAFLVCKDLYLLQSVRGKGLGRSLMQLQLDLAKKVRMDMVAVSVPKLYASSLPFFKSMGFELQQQQLSQDSVEMTENEENYIPTYTLTLSI